MTKGTKRTRPLTFDAWMTTALNAQMRAKHPPKDIDALRAAVVSTLPTELKAHKAQISKARIFEEIDDTVWKRHDNILRDAVNAKLSANKLHALLSRHRHGEDAVPPLWLVEAKLREMHGRTSAPREEQDTLPGILRVAFTDAKPRSLKTTTFAKPFHVFGEKEPGAHIKFGVISAPQLGLPYDPDIVRNLTRSGFSAARKMGCDALVIGGGLFRIVFQKTAGPNRLLVDLVNGSEIDIESIAKHYQREAAEIRQSGSYKPLFVTAAERLHDLTRGWFKATRRPGNRPEFTGPVYIVLSPDDLGLVRRMAYFDLLYQQHQRYLEAEALARLNAKVAATAYEHLVLVKRDGSKAAIKKAQKAYDDAKKESGEATEVAARARMTNLDSTQNTRVYKQALSYLIAKIEEMIPNAIVVDQNRAYIRFGNSDKVFKFVSGGDTANPHYENLESYGAAQRRNELPALTVVMHPRAVSPRETSREDYREGSMILRSPGGFFEAPMLVDREPILAATGGSRIPLPVVAAVADSRFAGGMLTVTIDPELGVNPDFIPAEAVRNIGAPRRGPASAPVKCFYFMVATDLHFGGSMRVKLRSPSGVPIGLPEAGFKLMQRSLDHGMAPVSGLIVADDILHGNHFGTHKRPHFHEKSNARVLRETEERLAVIRGMRKPPLIHEGYRELTRALADQIDARTVHYLTAQFTEMADSWLIPYRDVFKGILLRARESGVVVKGVSHFTPDFDFDMRDVGLINFGSGNHATKTTDEMLHEGVIVRDYVRLMLSADPDLKDFDLESLVQAPLLQDRTIGYGTVKAGHGYEYGLEIVGSPPKRDSWHDVLHGWPIVKRHTGNPSTILEGKATLHVTGDKHFFASHYAGSDIFVMGPSATHTDAFAYMAGGLAENTSGLAFVGLPVDGPDSGAINVVHLTPKVMQDFISTSERKFPWDEFLPNRL